jgi:hypothetical protein
MSCKIDKCMKKNHKGKIVTEQMKMLTHREINFLMKLSSWCGKTTEHMQNPNHY